MASKAMISQSGHSAKASEIPPNQALYLKNLPEKISKHDLRMSLYMLFSTYGTVLDVVVMRNGKMRGQAHVVFRDIQGSTQAMRALQDFDFYGREIKIQYGRGRSNIFARLEGVYKSPNATETVPTEVQQSIFNAPAVTATTVSAAGNSLPVAPVMTNGTGSEEASHGVKRSREDESDEEDAPMDEDDDDVSMEASSDED